MAIAVGMRAVSRRTDHILAAIKAELDKRRSSLNNDADVRSVTVVVKMKRGSDTPRATIMTVETETSGEE